jgi:glucoamylase
MSAALDHPLVVPVGLAPPQRRFVALALVLLLLSGMVGGGVLLERSRPSAVVLADTGVAVGADGRVVELRPGDSLIPGTRVLAGQPDSERWAAEQGAWLAAGRVPVVAGVDPTLVSSALLDLHVLSRSGGVPVAGWAGPWRYVWPRDAAVCAVALARTGHLADADRIFDFLQSVQPADGLLQARYLADGSGVPDGRGVQLDGVGWALWAMGETASRLPPSERAAFVQRHESLLRRSTSATLTAITNRQGLPRTSSDYWEVTERTTTLATAALLQAGLRQAVGLFELVGDSATAQGSGVAADRLGEAIRAGFEPDGYPRRLGGRSDSVDLGAAFLLPPYSVTADPRVVTAWRNGAVLMARPGGGLSPGGSWRRDGISWTNVTASYAVTAAALGDDDEARRWLVWLDTHRTVTGALPEKVRADGQPAAVAPLAWTAAAVIIAADLLSS